MEEKIDACKMWIWRKMLMISWTEKRTNESILMVIGKARGVLSLRQRAAKQKMMFFSHVMRANGIENDMMLACFEGRRKRGRPKKKWMKEIHTMSWMNLAEPRDAVEDRDVWRKLTMSIARTLRVEGTHRQGESPATL